MLDALPIGAPALSGYNFSLGIHITAVVVGLGATFAEAVLFPLALKQGTRHLAFVHRVQLAINRYLASPALLVILLTGLWQTHRFYAFDQLWIVASLAIVAVLGGLNGAYFIPTDRRLAEQAEREVAAGGGGDVTMSDDYLRQARREGQLGALAGLLVVLAIFLMTTKPGG